MATESALFTPNKNLVMACHITGVHDVNRNTTLAEDSYELVKDWAESITAANLQGVIFHNNFSEATCKLFESENISFIGITYDLQYNPNVFRYFVYRDFLRNKVGAMTGRGNVIAGGSVVIFCRQPRWQGGIKNRSVAYACYHPFGATIDGSNVHYQRQTYALIVM
jgi:hypothetical protein